MKKTNKSRFLSLIVTCLLVINTIISSPVLAAIPVNDGINSPKSTTGKTNITTWNYGSLAEVTAVTNGDFRAKSGYYNDATTLLQLWQGATPTKTTASSNSNGNVAGFYYSTSSLKCYWGFDTPSYWLTKTSTRGFKDLVFNFSTYSAASGPRDFNTEWSTDSITWTVFGEINDTGYTVKNQNSTTVNYGMTLPAEAYNQDVLYIRVVEKSYTATSGSPVTNKSGSNINNLQLYGAKDPLYTTPTVTATTATIPVNTTGILDVTPITLSCTDSAAQIYYTTDGTTPAATVGGSTKLYTTPLTALSEGGFSAADPFIVKAVAKNPALLTSDEVTLSYNQQVITSNEDAKKLAAGTYAWVKGIGTYSNQTRTVYIQDGMNVKSGICIDRGNNTGTEDFSSYVGKEIYVYGKVALYGAMIQIVPDTVNTTNIVVRNASPTLPTPTKIMFNQLSDRAYEGMLVAFDTVKLVTVAGTGTSNYNHKVSQAGIEYTLRGKGIAPAVGVN